MGNYYCCSSELTEIEEVDVDKSKKIPSPFSSEKEFHASMGQIQFFHPVKATPGNEIDLTIQAGKQATVMFKINNITNSDWPSGVLLMNNLTNEA